MGNRKSIPTCEKNVKEAVKPTSPNKISNKAASEPSRVYFLDLSPEIRTMIYELVLSDFDITTVDAEERDLAVPLLNVSKFVAEEALETYKKRIQASKKHASEELSTAIDELCTSLRTEYLPELDVRREKVAICEEELRMIAAVKREYGMK